MFETRECTLTKRDLVCIMTMISENAASMASFGNRSMVQLQEARVPEFSFHNNSDLQHQHDQCECWSIAKSYIFTLVLNILAYHLVINIP